MLTQSTIPNQIVLKDNPFKEYFQIEKDDNQILQKSINNTSGKYFGKIIGEKEYKETILETKLNKQLNQQKNKDRGYSIYYSPKEIKKRKLEKSLREIGILISETEQNLALRKLPEISDGKFKHIKKEIINKETLNQLYETIKNTNIDFKDPECHISI